MAVRAGTLAVLFITFTAAYTAKAERQLITPVEGRITIAADGSVSDVSLHHQKIDDVENDVLDRIKTWKFEPIQMNGAPSEATVALSFNLIATLEDSNSRKLIRFSDVGLGLTKVELELNEKNGLKTSKQPSLHFPSNMRADLVGTIGAVVEVAVEVGSDGTVKNTAIYRMGIINTDARSAKIHSRGFAKEALATISRFRWTPDELGYHGCTNGCVRIITADFRYNYDDIWQPYIPIDVEPVPWVVVSDLENIHGLEQGQLVRLKEDPTGKPIEIGG